MKPRCVCIGALFCLGVFVVFLLIAYGSGKHRGAVVYRRKNVYSAECDYVVRIGKFVCYLIKLSGSLQDVFT